MVYTSSMPTMTVVVRMMMLVILSMLRVVILVLIFRRHAHLHPISLVTLPIHDMLPLMTLVVHAERMVRWRLGDWRPRRRGCIVIIFDPATVPGRLISSKVPLMLVVLVVRIVILAGPRLLEPVLTICHLIWPQEFLLGLLQYHTTLDREPLVFRGWL